MPLSAAERLTPRQAFEQLKPALRHPDAVWEQAEGDLDGDGIADVAMLLRGGESKPDIEESLVVLAGTQDGGYRVLSVSGEFCRPSKSYNMSIEGGTLLVQAVESADSRGMGSTTMRFRYNAKIRDLQLIGEDIRSEDFETGEKYLSSTSFLTGQEVTTRRIKGKTKATKRQLPVTALTALNNWACNR